MAPEKSADFCRRRTREDVWLPLGIGALGLAGAIVPWFEFVVLAAIVLCGLTLMVLLVRRVRRAIRWRREDREDAAYAAAWRAAYRQRRQRATSGGSR